MTENEPESEKEKNPDQVVDNAITELENKDAEDPVISSGWAESIKKFWKDEEGGISTETLRKTGRIAGKIGKTTGIAAGISAGIVLFLGWRVLRATYEFAKKAIQKRGNVGFGEGYKIGEEMLSFGDKKDKK